jgi:SHS2 domain-containing protein
VSHAEQDRSPQCSFEELAHTAEVGMRVGAASCESLFACAGLGLFQLAGVAPGDARARRSITVESIDRAGLMVDWLSELLYLHETSGEVYDTIAIESLSETRLTATLQGALAIAPPERSIKAVTYYGLRIEESADGWTAEVYFDI